MKPLIIPLLFGLNSWQTFVAIIVAGILCYIIGDILFNSSNWFLKLIGAMLKVLFVSIIIVPLVLLLLPRGSISWFIDHGILGAIIFIAIVVIVSLVMTGHVDLGGVIFYDKGAAQQYSRMLREKKIHPNNIEEIY